MGPTATPMGGHDPGGWEPDPDREAETEERAIGRAAEPGRGVGPYAHEEGVPQRHLARQAGEEVQPQCSDHKIAVVTDNLSQSS